MTNHSDAPRSADSAAADRSPLRWALFEVVWLVLLFYLFAGSPPPDAGESHYLVKAKHYWNPAWCAGDLFLESRDAHLTYYWVFGWLTRVFSVETSAWIGRIVTWTWLAWTWRRLSWAIVPRPLWSLLSAGLLILLSRNFNWSRELAIGGFEAKTVAYGFVFLVLESIARDRWRAALLLSGAASAFHVLVGGWTAIAVGLAWIAGARERLPLVRLLPALAGGLVLSLPGLIPNVSLMADVPPQIAVEAARIYVFDRLPHHLVFHSFGTWHYLRHAALLAIWAALAWKLWNDARLSRLQRVVLGALFIAAMGIVLDLGPLLASRWTGASTLEYQLRAAPLLRLYWFRLEDALVPVAAALAMIVGLTRLSASRLQLGSWLLVGAILAAGINLADVCYWRAQVRVPGSVIQQRPTFDSRLRWWFDEPRPASRMYRPLPGSERLLTAEEWLRHWQDCCRWIAESTPPDARFLTPRRQQTFKWYAERAEVATWKDLPQDAASIVAWRQALAELYPHEPSHWEQDLAAFTDEELVALARKYDCQYVVIDRTRSQRRIGLPSVYPLFREENPAFEVFRVPVAGEREASVRGRWD